MSENRRPSDDVDVCIVGAGVAGGIVAASLAERGYSVVVLEAGPRFDEVSLQQRLERAIRPEFDRVDVWDGIEEARDRYTDSTPENVTCRLNTQRIKGVGGTTLHWSAHVPRLHEKDFEMHSRYGLAVDWPIDYEDIRPYYAMAEAEMGVAGGGDNPFVPRESDPPMEAHPRSYTDRLFQDACEELGVRTHSFPLAINTAAYDGRSQCVGYSMCSPVCPSRAKYAGDVHVAKAERAGARVVSEVPVQRLEHDSDGSSVEAAVYRTPEGETFRQSARHFVVASGGIETPRLLLLSESDQYPNGLANRSGAVGRYFTVAATVDVEGRMDVPTNDQPIAFPTMASEEFYDHDDPTPGSVRLWFGHDDPKSPVSAAIDNPPIGETLSGMAWGDELLDTIPDASENRSISVSAQVEMLPRYDNYVLLDESTTDSFGNPVPDVSLDVGSHAVETGEYAIELMTRILEEVGAEVVSVSDPREQAVGNHHKGTTRMGTDPDKSVVNARLRTHDLENLWLVSSSVFPTGGAVNPTLTIAALALRAADDLAATL